MKMKLPFRMHYSMGIVASLFFSHSVIADTVITHWNEAALQAIRMTHPGPPIVARALAITHTCMYDAWAAYDKKAKGTQLDDYLRRPTNEHTIANKSKAVSYAAHKCLSDLFPTQVSSFDALMNSLGYNPSDNSLDTNTAVGIGNIAAAAILEFRQWRRPL